MTRTGLRRLVSVAAGPLVLFGCATHAVEFPPQTPRGHIAARPGRPGLVVAAPHGSSDVQTGEIAAEVARRTGFGLVVATGFNLEPDTRERPGRRYQVNRPFEGAPSRPPSEDTASAVHIELPKAARVEFRDLYTAILADFVAQAVTLPRGR